MAVLPNPPPARPLRGEGTRDAGASQYLGASALCFSSTTLDLSVAVGDSEGSHLWGRTGFDLKNAPEAACRGRFVGLVKNRTKQNS